MIKIEKIEKGIYRYRGVRIFKYDYSGFSYKHSTRTDKYSRTDCTFPVPLKQITSKIDRDLDINGGVVDHAGYIVKDTRTQEGC
jgi:hypothetical protein